MVDTTINPNTEPASGYTEERGTYAGGLTLWQDMYKAITYISLKNGLENRKAK